MRKWNFRLGVALIAAISLAGCGTVPNGETEQSMSETVISESVVDSTAVQTSEEETDTEVETEEAVSPVQVSFETTSKDYTADDGTIVFTNEVTCPVVTMEDNPAIAELINNDLKSEISTSEESLQEFIGYAKEDYAYSLENKDTEFYPYGSTTMMEVQRKDDKILSFTSTIWSYMGGAHGDYVTVGLNYDIKTGERLAFEDVADNSETFRADILDYLINLAKSDGYKEKLFEQNGEYVEETLLAGTKWYFSNSGLTFISDPYALGSYAAGTIDFVVPYRELTGLKEDYLYNGNFEQETPVGMKVAYDLNGDGTEDTVYYQGEYDEDYGDTKVTLNVNDVDFSEEVELESPDMANYYLVDLDSTDAYTEIALMAYGPSDDQETYFYRYLEDGSLKLLGSVSDRWASGSCYLESNGVIRGRGRLSLLQTWFAPFYWDVTKDSIVQRDDKQYLPELDGSVSNEILQPVTVYKEADLQSETTELTPEDGPVHFTATDNKNWVTFTTADGRTFYLYLSDSSTIVSGEEELDAASVFDQLCFAD